MGIPCLSPLWAPKSLAGIELEPSTPKGRRAKETLIQTASGFVRERGIKGTRIDDVLDACGMGKSQFYHYFADKDALIQEVIRHSGTTL